MKTAIFAKDVNLSKLVEMLKICPCCKYVSNLYQTITFTSLLRINTYLANICICPHLSRRRKCNANLELQIYHIFAPFSNISKSVFSSGDPQTIKVRLLRNHLVFTPLEWVISTTGWGPTPFCKQAIRHSLSNPTAGSAVQWSDSTSFPDLLAYDIFKI